MSPGNNNHVRDQNETPPPPRGWLTGLCPSAFKLAIKSRILHDRHRHRQFDGAYVALTGAHPSIVGTRKRVNLNWNSDGGRESWATSSSRGDERSGR